MSKYTTELRWIVEHFARTSEDKETDFMTIDEMLNLAIPKIFDFDFPLFDENYRTVLCKKILKHYYTREISAETYGLWKLWLDTRLNEIMPYYNKLYESELIKFNPMYDVDLWTKKDETDNKTENEGKLEHEAFKRDDWRNQTDHTSENIKENENYTGNTTDEQTNLETRDLKGSADVKDNETTNVNRYEDESRTRDRETTINETTNSTQNVQYNEETTSKQTDEISKTGTLDSTKNTTDESDKAVSGNPTKKTTNSGKDTTTDTKSGGHTETGNFTENENRDLTHDVALNDLTKHSDTPQGTIAYTTGPGVSGGGGAGGSGSWYLSDVTDVNHTGNTSDNENRDKTGNDSKQFVYDEEKTVNETDFGKVIDETNTLDEKTHTTSTGKVTENQSTSDTENLSRDITGSKDYTQDTTGHEEINRSETENETEHNFKHTSEQQDRDYTSNKNTTDTGTVQNEFNATQDNTHEQLNESNRDNWKTSEYKAGQTRDTTNDQKRTANIQNINDYLQHVGGKRGYYTYSKMLMEFRDTFLNIDMMIINALSDLFMQIW